MIAFSFQVSDLPDLLRFDGVQEFEGSPSYLQFTELDEKSASYGATFYVDARSAILDAILSRREEKRVQFATAAPAPVFERGTAQ